MNLMSAVRFIINDMCSAIQGRRILLAGLATISHFIYRYRFSNFLIFSNNESTRTGFSKNSSTGR
jgi:hypothetical protein